MIDVKTAVASAAQYAKQWLGTEEVLLEEVQLSKSGEEETRAVTLSIPRRGRGPLTQRVAASAVELLYGEREHKICSVDANTGEVRSMKIRNLVHDL